MSDFSETYDGSWDDWKYEEFPMNTDEERLAEATLRNMKYAAGIKNIIHMIRQSYLTSETTDMARTFDAKVVQDTLNAIADDLQALLEGIDD